METAILIIKPQWCKHEADIVQMLISAGLAVVRRVVATIDRRTVLDMYPECLDEQVQAVIIEQLTTGPSVILLIEGDNAARRVVSLSGEFTDPGKCAPGTIRQRFGTTGAVQVGGVMFFLNVVHRSKTDLESVRDHRLFLPYFDRSSP